MLEVFKNIIFMEGYLYLLWVVVRVKINIYLE